MTEKKRKVCVVVASRANYGRAKSIIRAIQQSEILQLQLVVAGSALISRFGKVVDIIESDGFRVDERCHFVVDGATPRTMASSTGLAIVELSGAFERIKPDVVVTIADRYETMATAIAASYMNIPLAHTQGGELTGSIDESVRHAITKLSHIHFPATELSKTRLKQMGENPEMIFNVGCPAMDEISNLSLEQTDEFRSFINSNGVGDVIDFSKPYVVFLQHPVTNEFSAAELQIEQSLLALEELDIQKIVLWPNIDAGTDIFSNKIRSHRENNKIQDARFLVNLPILYYATLIKHAAFMLGNSSSAIREGSFLGVPGINVGSRQNKRERATNIIDVSYDKESILAAAEKIQNEARPLPTDLYGDGHAGHKIAKALETASLEVKKEFFDIN